MSFIIFHTRISTQLNFTGVAKSICCLFCLSCVRVWGRESVLHGQNCIQWNLSYATSLSATYKTSDTEVCRITEGGYNEKSAVRA